MPIGIHYKPNDMMSERYLVIKTLEGGMGEVYIALDIALDIPVAIKTYHTRYLQNKKVVEMFVAEAQKWIQLERHKNIVQAKNIFLIDQQPFIVIEFVDGGSIRDKMKNRPLDIKLAINLAIQFCTGAMYAYQKLKLVHRDIKPENLLLNNKGTLKIIDFGLSMTGLELQKVKEIAGTPAYMSPEQWIGAEVTKQSDIYSFGVVLYEMLAGNMPFVAQNFEGFRKAHFEEAPPNPKEKNSNIPTELAMIVLKCLEKNPNKRFLYYEDLADQLQLVYKFYTGKKYTPDIEDETDLSSISNSELLNMGDSLFVIGRYKEAIVYYDKLIELDPKVAMFWQRKRETFRKLNKYHEAILYFDKAQEIEHSNLNVVKGKVECLICLDKRDDAFRCLDPSLKLNPNNVDLLRLKRELLPVALKSYQSEIVGNDLSKIKIEYLKVVSKSSSDDPSNDIKSQSLDFAETKRETDFKSDTRTS